MVNIATSTYRRGIKSDFELQASIATATRETLSPIILLNEAFFDSPLQLYGFRDADTVRKFLRACHNVAEGSEIQYPGWDWVSNLKPADTVLKLLEFVLELHPGSFYMVGYNADESDANNVAACLERCLGIISTHKVGNASVTLPTIAIVPASAPQSKLIKLAMSRNLAVFLDAGIEEALATHADWTLSWPCLQKGLASKKFDSTAFPASTQAVLSWKSGLEEKFVSERVHYTHPYVIWKHGPAKHWIPGCLVSGLLYCKFKPGTFPTALPLPKTLVPSGLPLIHGIGDAVESIVSQGIGTFEYVEGRGSFYMVGNYNALGSKNGTIATHRRHMATVLLCDGLERDLRSGLRQYLDNPLTQGMIAEIKHVICQNHLEPLGDALRGYAVRVQNESDAGTVGELIFDIDLDLTAPLEFVGLRFLVSERSK